MITPQTKEVTDVCCTQQENNGFSVRTAAVKRRHSADATLGSGSGSARGPVDSDRFHPYRQQFSDGASCLNQCSPSFSCLQEVCSSDTRSHSSSDEAPTSWDQYNGSIQVSRLLVHTFYPHLLFQLRLLLISCTTAQA